MTLFWGIFWIIGYGYIWIRFKVSFCLTLFWGIFWIIGYGYIWIRFRVSFLVFGDLIDFLGINADLGSFLCVLIDDLCLAFGCYVDDNTDNSTS